MSIKILTKTGAENTAIDDARAYNFDAGNKSGIVKGALNEGRLFLVSENVIAIDSCELRIAGHRIIIDSAESITLSNKPNIPTRYSLIAEVVVNDSSVPNFRLFVQSSKIELIQQNLYKTLNGNGTYQIRLANFTLDTQGLISDLVRVVDIISGSTNNVGDIEFDVTTETIAGDLAPEVNVDFNEETKKYDMHFALPQTSGSSVIENGEVVSRFNADTKVSVDEYNQDKTLIDESLTDLNNSTVKLEENQVIKGEITFENIVKFVKSLLDSNGNSFIENDANSSKFGNVLKTLELLCSQRPTVKVGNTNETIAYRSDIPAFFTQNNVDASNTKVFQASMKLGKLTIKFGVDYLTPEKESVTTKTINFTEPFTQYCAGVVTGCSSASTLRTTNLNDYITLTSISPAIYRTNTTATYFSWIAVGI